MRRARPVKARKRLCFGTRVSISKTSEVGRNEAFLWPLLTYRTLSGAMLTGRWHPFTQSPPGTFTRTLCFLCLWALFQFMLQHFLICDSRPVPSGLRLRLGKSEKSTVAFIKDTYVSGTWHALVMGNGELWRLPCAHVCYYLHLQNFVPIQTLLKPL